MKSEPIWYAEIYEKICGHSTSCEFLYTVYVPGKDRKEARKNVKVRTFFSKEELYSMHYDEGCPVPQAMTVHREIRVLSKAKKPYNQGKLEDMARWFG